MIAILIMCIIACLLIGLRQIPCMNNGWSVWALVFIFLIAISVQAFAADVRVVQRAEPTTDQGKAQKTLTVTPYNPALPQKIFRVVLVCDTPESRAEGLQGFRKLKKDEAALFIFDKPDVVTFWMGSVQYPIDIIFVGPDKKVIRVYANRKPGSNELYPSMMPAKWVIETAAGSKIKVGDKVSFK
jgi:uncharacterized membrane protein (UPF0127 family)